MGKRALLNLWLAVALMALVWVVWQEPGHAPKPAAVKLTELAPAAIDKIVISNHNGSISFLKQDGAWQMVTPIKIAANPVRIDSLMELAQAESVSRFAAKGRDLAQYGLDKPAIQVRFNDTELLVGGVTPVGQQRYVKLGDTIHLIADRFQFDLTADASAFVSRDLVPHGKKIVAVELPHAKLSLDAKHQWSLTPPDKGLSQDALQRVADEWRDAQALRVAAYDKRPEQGAVVIRVEGAPQPLRYEIIARKPELILARPEIGMQFYLAPEQAERLLDNIKPAAAAAAVTNKK
jgi:hypothetical protein